MYNKFVHIEEEGVIHMLSERITKIRKLNNLTQEGLAKKLKVTKGTVSNYENGHSTPSNDMLKDIADTLNVDTDYLLGRTDIPKKQTSENNNMITELNRIIENLGIEHNFFYDIEAWKNFNEEDLAEIKKHFEWVAHKAKERNEGENK